MQKLRTASKQSDVDYVFISMDKADKWKPEWKNMRYPEITIWLTIKWKVYKTIDLDWIQDILFLTKRVKSFFTEL
jgi:hypothetical protein